MRLLIALATLLALPIRAGAAELDCSVDLLDAGAAGSLGYVQRKLTSYHFRVAHTGKARTPRRTTEIYVTPECEPHGRVIAELLRLPAAAVQPRTWKSPYPVTVAVDRALADGLGWMTTYADELLGAMRAKRWEEVDQLLASNKDIDVNVAPAGAMESPLYLAVIENRPAVVRKLIQRGAQVSAPRLPSGSGGSLLLDAVYRSDLAVARILLDAGADPDVLGSQGWSLLTQLVNSYWNADERNAEERARKKQLLDALKLLLERGAHVGAGALPAQCLGVRVSPEVRELLFARGADLNVKCRLDSSTGEPESSLVQIVAEGGKVEALKSLLGRGLQIEEGSRVTALCYAAAGVNTAAMVRFLLEKGANPNAPCDPLGRAVQSGVEDSPQIVRMLLAKGAKMADPRILLRASGQEVAKLLVDAGADVKAKDARGNTALHLTTDPGLIAFLAERGANVNARNDDGVTPLLRALTETESCDEGDCYAAATMAPIWKALLAAKADPNLADRTGMTPLHWAATHADPPAIAALLAAGAAPNARTSGDKRLTPRACAEALEAPCRECIRLLREAEGKQGT